MQNQSNMETSVYAEDKEDYIKGELSDEKRFLSNTKVIQTTPRIFSTLRTSGTVKILMANKDPKLISGNDTTAR